MRFKLIIAFVDDACTDEVLDAARAAGATGATVINHARGEGIKQKKTFMGLTLDVQRDVMLFLVEEHISREILEKISRAGKFDSEPGKGIAIQINVEDAVGVAHQVDALTKQLGDQLV
ncbi:MAG: P-II family nitrogen regulator [Parashewanella sp.]